MFGSGSEKAKKTRTRRPEWSGNMTIVVLSHSVIHKLIMTELIN